MKRNHSWHAMHSLDPDPFDEEDQEEIPEDEQYDGD